MKFRILLGIGVIVMLSLAGCAQAKVQTQEDMQIRSSKTQEQSAQPQQASAYHKISPRKPRR